MGVLSEQMSLSRRGFIFASLSAAGGLVLGIRPLMAASPEYGNEIGAWIAIDPDESITIRVAKSEMGQGVYTALPMIVAEELACDWRHVRAEFVQASRNLVDKQIYGRLGTGGSRSVRGSHEMLQQVGASARARLIAAAAKRWQVSPADCAAADGFVQHGAGGERLSYGTLAAEAAAIELDQEPGIKAPANFTLAGKPLARRDTAPKCTARPPSARYPPPDMLYAAVALWSVPGGKVASYDDGVPAPGIHSVVPVPGGPRSWRIASGAKEAAAALPCNDPASRHSSPPGGLPRARRPLQIARRTATPRRARAPHRRRPAHRGTTRSPTFPCPMEPLNCTARVTPDGRGWLGPRTRTWLRNSPRRRAWR
jgi:isoquinoline 1-oxidoreductase beta subunit